jgi:hypothetical protein
MAPTAISEVIDTPPAGGRQSKIINGHIEVEKETVGPVADDYLPPKALV